MGSSLSFDVSLPNGEVVHFNLPPTTTVLHLKELLEKKSGIAIKDQQLLDSSVAESDTAELSTFLQHLDKKNPILELRVRKEPKPTSPVSQPAAGGSNDATPMTIFVKTLTGKVVPMQIAKNATIEDAKLAIQTSEGIPPDQQRLIYKSKQMKDEETLEQHSVVPESTVHLVLRLRGSPDEEPPSLVEANDL
jgi:hypothetical protein